MSEMNDVDDVRALVSGLAPLDVKSAHSELIRQAARRAMSPPDNWWSRARMRAARFEPVFAFAVAAVYMLLALREVATLYGGAL